MRGLPIIFNLFHAETKILYFETTYSMYILLILQHWINQSIIKKNSENSIENKRRQKRKVKWNSKISYSDIIAKSVILSVVVHV